MKIIWMIWLALILIFIYNYVQISRFYINKPVFHSNKISNDLRITQISDYHENSLINKNRLLDKILNFNPHIIVLTGDIIDSKTEDIDSVLMLIEEIYQINKRVFFVIGNHELRNVQRDRFISKLREIGVIILDNENTVLDINEYNINIIGLSFFASREDYKKAIKGINTKNFTIILSHSPSRPISYVSGIEDLILSGHTHGGQVRLPLIGALTVPGQGLLPKYDKGVFELEDTILYIDSGLGNSVFPIRLFNRIQISNITIRN